MSADHSQRTNVSMMSWFGLKIDADVLKYMVCGLALNSVLYMGEIFQIYKGMVRIGYTYDILAFKNLVVAPLFEEFIYRVCLINMFMEAKALNEHEAVYYLPVYFALSHLHHIFA